MRITVVLPTYNEADNLPRMVRELLALPLPGHALSILVVDDNSPDGTGALADALAAEHPGRVGVAHRPGKGGLGKAYVDAFQRVLATGAELVLQMDCDFSHQPRFVPALIEALPGHDMVLGSRFVPGGRVDRNWPWWRKLLSRFANGFYVRSILGMPLHDATGGFRLWRSETLRGMDVARRVHSNGYVFMVEMAYLCWRLGYRICEVPIEFPDRQAGTSKMSLRIQVEAAVRVFDVKARHRALTAADRAAER